MAKVVVASSTDSQITENFTDDGRQFKSMTCTIHSPLFRHLVLYIQT